MEVEEEPPVHTESEAEADPDPVVTDIPVFLSKAGSCYLYQYPVRPGHMTYDGSQVIRARFRPLNQQAQLELAINTKSENYDESKGEQIALNTDGASAGPTKYFQTSKMDKQLLTGSSPVASTGRYALAILDNEELHLTPVKGVLQLRPSLAYMDKSDKTARLEARNSGDNVEEEDNKPQAVTVRFTKVRINIGHPNIYLTLLMCQGDSDRLKKLKEKSFDYQMRMVEEEPWVECDYQQAKTAGWDSACQKLFCNKTEPVKTLDSSAQQYLCDLKDPHG